MECYNCKTENECWFLKFTNSEYKEVVIVCENCKYNPVFYDPDYQKVNEEIKKYLQLVKINPENGMPLTQSPN